MYVRFIITRVPFRNAKSNQMLGGVISHAQMPSGHDARPAKKFSKKKKTIYVGLGHGWMVKLVCLNSIAESRCMFFCKNNGDRTGRQ